LNLPRISAPDSLSSSPPSISGEGLAEFRRSLELLPLPAILVSLRSRRILAASPTTFGASLRLSPDEVLGKTPEELGFRADAEGLVQVLDATANGSVHHTIRSSVGPDGVRSEYMHSSRRIVVDGEECLFSCYQPSTRFLEEAEKKVSRAEADLRTSELERQASEEQNWFIAQNSIDTFSRHSVDGTFLYISPSCRGLMGRSPEEIVGRDAFFMVHPDDRDRIMACLGPVLVSEGPSHLEYRLVRPDGVSIWVDSVVQALRDPATGQVTELLSSSRDITERKNQEEALRTSEFFFRESQRASSTGSYQLPLATGIWECSETLLDIFGIDDTYPRTVEGWLDLVHPDDRESMRHHFVEEVVARNGKFDREYRIVRKSDGELRWVHGLGRLVPDESGAPALMTGTIRDITERRKAQEEVRALTAGLEQKVHERTADLRRAVEELESFSYTISHDLRSPLRAIDGYSKALLEEAGEDLSEEHRHFLARIRHASQHMGTLIDGLLQLSRSGRVELRKQGVDLSAICVDLLRSFAEQEPSRKVESKVEPGIRVRADPVLLRSILDNLLGNAWKYSSRQEISRISVAARSGDGRLWIHVEDNGVGFDPKYASRLFGTFQRLHPNSEFEGSGIGLATVRKLVERHGGAVRADGIPSRGAVFSFTLDGEAGANP